MLGRRGDTKRLACIVGLAVALAACSTPATSAPIAQPTARPVADFAATTCAGIDYAKCVDSLRLASTVMRGELVAICTYPDLQGDVVLIDAEAEAEAACSSDGTIQGSKVAKVVRIP